MKCPNKSLNFGSANSPFPSFCLQINHIQTEAIFFDYSIDSFVSGLTQCLSGIDFRTAITPLQS